MVISMYFTLNLCFKPYVRMTQNGKWVKPEAQAYLSSQHEIAHTLKVLMAEKGWTMISRGKPLSAMMRIRHSHGFNNRDLDNEIKAIMDAAQGVVFEDDRWIDSIGATRERADECSVSLLIVTIPEEDDD